MVIIPSIIGSDGCIHQLIDIDVFEAIDAGNVEFAAQLGIVSPPEWTHTPVPAENMVDVVQLIVDEVRLPPRATETCPVLPGHPTT